MKNIASIMAFLVLTALCGQPASARPQQTAADIYKDNIQRVFTVHAGNLLGSGFTFKSGLIATNAHVVAETSTVEIEAQDGTRYPATVIHKDLKRDFAILKPVGISPFTTVIPVAIDSTPPIGDGIVVIGSPGGLKGTVTIGIVSQIYRDGVIQLNVAVNPGNSGGPVFDMQGRVIGIATMKYAQGDGLGFAIPMQWLESVAGP